MQLNDKIEAFICLHQVPKYTRVIKVMTLFSMTKEEVESVRDELRDLPANVLKTYFNTLDLDSTAKTFNLSRRQATRLIITQLNKEKGFTYISHDPRMVSQIEANMMNPM